MSQASSSDVSMEQVKKTIEDTTTYQNQRLAESFRRIQETTSSHRDDIIKTITSAEKCPSDIILAVHDDVRSLISSMKNQKEEEILQKTLAEEINEINELKPAETESHGWRFIGSKKIWKPDWTNYDARQRTRRLQEKEADKARRRQRKNRQQSQQQQHHHRQQHQQQQLQRQQLQHPHSQSICNSDVGRNIRLNSPHFELSNENSSINNNNNVSSSNNVSPSLPKLSDKQLLDKARVTFAGQPSPTSNLNFINFRKGETINPYQKEKTPIIPPLNATTPQPSTTTTTPEITDSMFCLDPMKPPIVRLTEQSACGDGKFLLARLREPQVYQNLRLYLAFLKDQPMNYCLDGMTPTSMQAYLYSQGLPKSDEQLLSTLQEFHASIGISSTNTLADLEGYKQHMTSKKIQHLQQSRESANKFYRPLSSNFTKY